MQVSDISYQQHQVDFDESIVTDSMGREVFRGSNIAAMAHFESLLTEEELEALALEGEVDELLRGEERANNQLRGE